MTSLEKLAMSHPDFLTPTKVGEIVEVEVLERRRGALICDIGGVALGIVPEREWDIEANTLMPGTKTLAYVLALEGPEGMALLSMRRANRERVWKLLREKQGSREPVVVRVLEVSATGLVVQLASLKGFIPLSHLGAERTSDLDLHDREAIRERFTSLIGQLLTVRVLSADKRTGKLIFSEKAVLEKPVEIRGIKVGEVVEGTVTGLAPFGIFINLGPYDGLIHISEVSWGRIEDLSEVAAVGDRLKATVVAVENGRISLSLKRLQADPWEKVRELREGSLVLGRVSRHTSFGSFIELAEGIEGLIREVPEAKLEIGEEREFIVDRIDEEARRITLRLPDRPGLP